MKNFLQQLIFLLVLATVFGGFYAIASYERNMNGKSDVAKAESQPLITYIQSSTTPPDESNLPHASPILNQSDSQIIVNDTPQTITKNSTTTPKTPESKYTTNPRAYTVPPSVGVPLTQKVTGPAPAGTAASVPVLLYHGEGSLEGNTPVNAFINQMQTLKRAGWNTITLKQFYDYMKNGIPVPDKSFLLTFDDGRKDSYYPVDPVLQQLNYTAVMFVITGSSLPDNGKSSDFYLNKDELTQMVKSGRWDLQSHGKEDHKWYPIATSTPDGMATTTPGHFLSNRFVSPQTNQLETENEFRQRITTDLTLSKMTLEQDFGKTVYAFAYPFNDFGQDTVNYPDSQRIIADIVPSIYTFTFYQTWPGEGEMFNSPDPNAYMIRRIEPNINWNGQQLLATLERSRARALPYQSDSFGPEWSGSWGKSQYGSTLVLSASPISTGAAVTLNGSSGWTDYTLNAVADWSLGSEASLIARHHDATHYLSCDFSQGTAYIEEHVNDKQIIIGKAQYDTPTATQNVSLAMTVKGNAIACSVAGQPVVSALTSNNLLLSGGVGLQVWNPTLGAAEMHVHSITVSKE